MVHVHWHEPYVALDVLAQLVGQQSFHSEYQPYDHGVGWSWSL